MKFLFVTFESLSVDLAWQLKKEGHEVKMYCHDQGEKDVGLGFFDKVEEWEPLKDWADVIVFDDIGFGSKAEQLRNEGKFVVGGSAYTDKLELDREFGQAELNLMGVDVLPSWNFTSFDEAVEFVKKNPDRYVLKPSGKAQSEKELLFIGQEVDGKDILQVLEHYKVNWSKKIKEFQMQKFAEGVEVAVGAFFNGKEFVMPVCVNFEHKRLFPGELGPSTGEMGTAMFYTRNSPVFERTLAKAKEKLATSKYVGYVDINCITNSKGIWPLEWTCRFGYPTISIQMEGITSEWGPFLSDIAHGNDPQLKTKKGYQIGVVVAIPPWPFEDEKAFKKYSEGATILFKRQALDGIHIGEVKLEEGDWRTAGNSGYALVVTGSGATMADAIEKAYQNVSNVMIPNMFYRRDIGQRWTRDSDKLISWGYI
ncbi:MAG: phosphoribosylamine--glycine ligase [Nitrososphaerota archaeon]|nr:phosphoribosylamine--glycine ligase [Nitrososphaerota archaeon]MDG7024529.1 phosphoribosylamine--glycine ligase [Nitrososphaerota archaeon]